MISFEFSRRDWFVSHNTHEHWPFTLFSHTIAMQCNKITSPFLETISLQLDQSMKFLNTDKCSSQRILTYKLCQRFNYLTMVDNKDCGSFHCQFCLGRNVTGKQRKIIMYWTQVLETNTSTFCKTKWLVMATSHCWPRSLVQDGITRPLCVNLILCLTIFELDQFVFYSIGRIHLKWRIASTSSGISAGPNVAVSLV